MIGADKNGSKQFFVDKNCVKLLTNEQYRLLTVNDK